MVMFPAARKEGVESHDSGNRRGSQRHSTKTTREDADSVGGSGANTSVSVASKHRDKQPGYQSATLGHTTLHTTRKQLTCG